MGVPRHTGTPMSGDPSRSGRPHTIPSDQNDSGTIDEIFNPFLGDDDKDDEDEIALDRRAVTDDDPAFEPDPVPTSPTVISPGTVENLDDDDLDALLGISDKTDALDSEMPSGALRMPSDGLGGPDGSNDSPDVSEAVRNDSDSLDELPEIDGLTAPDDTTDSEPTDITGTTKDLDDSGTDSDDMEPVPETSSSVPGDADDLDAMINSLMTDITGPGSDDDDAGEDDNTEDEDGGFDFVDADDDPGEVVPEPQEETPDDDGDDWSDDWGFDDEDDDNEKPHDEVKDDDDDDAFTADDDYPPDDDNTDPEDDQEPDWDEEDPDDDTTDVDTAEKADRPEDDQDRKDSGTSPFGKLRKKFSEVLDQVKADARGEDEPVPSDDDNNAAPEDDHEEPEPDDDNNDSVPEKNEKSGRGSGRSGILSPVKKFFSKIVDIFFSPLMFILGLLSRIPIVGKFVKPLMNATKILRSIAGMIPVILVIGICAVVSFMSVPRSSTISLPDEGSANFSQFSYTNGRAEGTIQNTGNIIADVSARFTVYTIQPSINPKDWFVPRPAAQCSSKPVSVDIDGDKKITASCGEVKGFIPRVSGELNG